MHLGSKEVRGHVLPSSLKGGIPKANSKGALDPNLHISFKVLVKKRVLDIAIVMEPRISGRAADVFIRKADRLAVAERSSSRCGLLLPFPPADLSTLVEEENKQNAGKPVLTQDWRVTANVVCFNLHSDLGG
ncbi:hypothetical protein V6N13_016725 [Hibiscus sabdariffa]